MFTKIQMIGMDVQYNSARLSLLPIVKYTKKFPFFVQYCTENRNSNQFPIITDTPDGGKWAWNRT